MPIPINLARRIYFSLQRLRREPVEAVTQELRQSQWRPHEELVALQWQRLKAILAHAYDNNAFYRERFERQGLHPADIKTSGDITKIPTLQKVDIQRHFHQIADSGTKRPSTLASTSGSTGTPLKLLRDNESWAYLHANLIRGLQWYGIPPGAPYGMVGGIGTGLQNRVKGELKDWVHNRIHLYAADMDTPRCMAFINRMRAFKPYYLYGYPTAIDELAQIILNNANTQPPPTLKIILVHGEELEDDQRQRIGAAFSARVVNSYGCAEVGIIGFECPQGSLHVPAESLYLESIDSSAVVTDLFSYSFPIIRYELGDSFDLTEVRCACGRELPLIANLKGKLRQVIELPNGHKVHTVFFNSLFKDLSHRGAPIERYQIVRIAPARFRLRLVTRKPLHERYRGFLLRRCQEHLGGDCHFDIVLEDHIERSPSGKFRTYYEDYAES